MTVLEIVLGVLIAGGACYAERQLHPTRRCPRCNGTGHNAGSNAIRWGTCGRCAGKGEVRRLGARNR